MDVIAGSLTLDAGAAIILVFAMIVHVSSVPFEPDCDGVKFAFG